VRLIGRCRNADDVRPTAGDIHLGGDRVRAVRDRPGVECDRFAVARDAREVPRCPFSVLRGVVVVGASNEDRACVAAASGRRKT
jgi:hypothetical protein